MPDPATQGFDLGDYLRHARAEGQLEASEKSFTIAKDKALDKLAHFALPGPYDWVLKIVQAANAWGCDRLQIGQTHVATSFYMKPSEDRFPSDGELVSALQNGSLETEGGVHELCLALRTLVDQARLSFVLALRTDGKLGEPITFGADVDKLSDRERRRWADLKVDGLRLTVSHFQEDESARGRYLPTFSSVKRRDLEIVKVLEERAFLSPCPIHLDGRDITNPFHNPRVGRDLIHRPLALGFLPQEEKGDVEWDTVGVLSDIDPLRRPRRLSDPNLHWCLLRCFEWYRYCSSDALSTLLTVDIKTDSYHRFFWLRHGVISHTRTLRKRKEKTTLFVMCPGHNLDSDLTGLSLNFDDHAQEHLKKLQSTLRDSLDDMVKRVPYLSSKVAKDANLPFQKHYTDGPEDMEGLKAGETLLSANLVTQPRLGRFLSKVYLEQSKRLNRSELLERWKNGVRSDLKDIRDRIRGTTREDS